MQLAPATYEASSYVLLLPPTVTINSDGSTSIGDNPYLALGGLQPAVDVLARSMLDATTAQSLKNAGITSKYNVVRDLTTDGPVLIITTDDTTSVQTLVANAAVVKRLAPTMQALQKAQNVRPDAYVTVENLSIAKKATTVLKTELRAVLIAVVAGLVLTVLAASLLDGMIRRSRNRRLAAMTTDGPEGDPGNADVATADYNGNQWAEPDSGGGPTQASEGAPGTDPRELSPTGAGVSRAGVTSPRITDEMIGQR
jgi:hypothetical protein